MILKLLNSYNKKKLFTKLTLLILFIYLFM